MKITKRQLRRIIREEKAKVLAEQKVRRVVRRRLVEMYGGSPSPGGAPALGKDGKVIFTDGAYQIPGAGFATDAEDHPLDQLQDLLDMGVRTVEDGESDMGVMPIMKWKDTVARVAQANDDDAVYGPPRRWRG